MISSCSCLGSGDYQYHATRVFFDSRGSYQSPAHAGLSEEVHGSFSTPNTGALPWRPEQSYPIRPSIRFGVLIKLYSAFCTSAMYVSSTVRVQPYGCSASHVKVIYFPWNPIGYTLIPATQCSMRVLSAGNTYQSCNWDRSGRSKKNCLDTTSLDLWWFSWHSLECTALYAMDTKTSRWPFLSSFFFFSLFSMLFSFNARATSFMLMGLSFTAWKTTVWPSAIM